MGVLVESTVGGREDTELTSVGVLGESPHEEKKTGGEQQEESGVGVPHPEVEERTP